MFQLQFLEYEERGRSIQFARNNITRCMRELLTKAGIADGRIRLRRTLDDLDVEADRVLRAIDNDGVKKSVIQSKCLSFQKAASQ